MKYFDFRKSYAENIDEDNVERDKKALEKTIMSIALQEKESIVNRFYEISDIGCIEAEERLVNIVKEAEWLYGYGFFIGCISVVGLVSEEFSKILAEKHHVSKNSTPNQDARIHRLKSEHIISEEIADKLNYIRLIRNECMHFKDTFANMRDEQTSTSALKMLNYFKEIMSVTYTHSEDDIIFLSNSKMNSDTIANAIRNAMSKNEETNLIISDKKYILRKRVFKILEVDINGNDFKELTLLDMEVGMPFVVDLTYAQADYVYDIHLNEGGVIIASCISVVTVNGLTEAWHLLNIDQIIF